MFLSQEHASGLGKRLLRPCSFLVKNLVLILFYRLGICILVTRSDMQILTIDLSVTCIWKHFKIRTARLYALCTIRQICLSYFSRQSWWTPTPRCRIWSTKGKTKPSMLYVSCCMDSETFHCGLKMRNEHFGIAICSCHSLARSVSLFTAMYVDHCIMHQFCNRYTTSSHQQTTRKIQINR